MNPTFERRWQSALALTFAALLTPTSLLASLDAATQQPAPSIPSTSLSFGVFTARFGDDGAFTLEGEGWPSFKGTWRSMAGRSSS